MGFLVVYLFVCLCFYYQERVVRCIGTDADNIRPAQRALQMFKNPAILHLLMGTSAPNPNPPSSSSSLAKSTGSQNSSASSSPVPGAMPSTTAIRSSSSTSSTSAGAKDSSSNSIRSAADAVASESLSHLLPALFRGGQLSWNPTVNKMTGLALRSLQVIAVVFLTVCRSTYLLCCVVLCCVVFGLFD
jgi:hypothetical protein